MRKDQMTAWVAQIRKMTVLERPETGQSDEALDFVLHEIIERIVFADPLSRLATADEKKSAAEQVFHSLRRLDILEPLIQDPEVTEIMVNGPDHIFVERKGRISAVNMQFESRERLEDLIQSLVSRVNRTVNESNPIVDARLEDGSRINVILSPVALDGPLLTIRRFPKKPLDMQQLIAMGAITKEAAGFLEKLVLARYNLFICGGTGSGKTTFLNVLSSYIPKTERIVTMEDSAELQLSGIPNLARLETRNPNTEGQGSVSMKQLIKTSLRMRPDRIIVGEVRGEEAYDMLQAMNTGHDGSMSTGHANSVDDMMTRLETMVLMAAALPLEAIRKQIVSAVDIVIYLQRMRDHSRRVVEIAEIVGVDTNGIRTEALFSFVEETDIKEKYLNEAVKGEGVSGQLLPTEATEGPVSVRHRPKEISEATFTGQLRSSGVTEEPVLGQLRPTGTVLKRCEKLKQRGLMSSWLFGKS